MAHRLPHYCIVGGGISGLTTAYLLSLARPPGSYRMTLVESTARFGGWIHSKRNADTGAVYELGPHSARATTASSQLLLRLALSLNMDQKSFVWMKSDGDAGQRFIYCNNQLVPVSPVTVRATKPFTRSPLGLIMRRLFSQRPPAKSDLSVDEFLRTRLDDEFADYFGSAMMRGIYAGDSRKLSARACLPQLMRYEEEGPNLLLGMLKGAISQSFKSAITNIPEEINSKLPSVSNSLVPPHTFAWSLSNGMQMLTDALVSQLQTLNPTVTLHTKSPVQRIVRAANKFRVQCAPNSNHPPIDDADAVFICCPAPQTATLLQDTFPDDTLSYLDPNRGLPWVDVAAAVFELDGPGAQPPVRGFGHLVPTTEDTHVLGCIYDSVALPQLDSPKGTIRYTVMMRPYADWLSSEASESEMRKSIGKVALDALIKQLGLSNPQLVGQEISLLRSCIPQYPLGHVERVKSLREHISHSSSTGNSGRVHLVGYSYDGVGLGDVVHSALDAVSRELELTRSV